MGNFDLHTWKTAKHYLEIGTENVIEEDLHSRFNDYASKVRAYNAANLGIFSEVLSFGKYLYRYWYINCTVCFDTEMRDFFLDFVSKGKFIPHDYSVFIIDNVFFLWKKITRAAYKCYIWVKKSQVILTNMVKAILN